MTTPAARARDTPGRAVISQQIDGVLIVDMGKVSARYICHRPGCLKPHEEPLKASTAKAFIDGIKKRHLAEFHGSTS